MRLSALMGLVFALASVAALAKDASPDSVKGLYLTTDFPAVTIRAGEEADLPLTIYNYGLPPQRTALTVAESILNLARSNAKIHDCRFLVPSPLVPSP